MARSQSFKAEVPESHKGDAPESPYTPAYQHVPSEPEEHEVMSLEDIPDVPTETGSEEGTARVKLIHHDLAKIVTDLYNDPEVKALPHAERRRAGLLPTDNPFYSRRAIQPDDEVHPLTGERMPSPPPEREVAEEDAPKPSTGRRVGQSPEQREARRQDIINKLPKNAQTERVAAAAREVDSDYITDNESGIQITDARREALGRAKGQDIPPSLQLNAEDFPVPSTESTVSLPQLQGDTVSNDMATNLANITDARTYHFEKAKAARKAHMKLQNPFDEVSDPDSHAKWKAEHAETLAKLQKEYDRTRKATQESRRSVDKSAERTSDVVPTDGRSVAEITANHVAAFKAHAASGDTEAAKGVAAAYWNTVNQHGAVPGMEGICGNAGEGCLNTVAGDAGALPSPNKSSRLVPTEESRSTGGTLCPSCEAAENAASEALKPQRNRIRIETVKEQRANKPTRIKRAKPAEDKVQEASRALGSPAKPVVRSSQDSSSDAEADAMMEADAQVRKQQEIAAGRKVELP